MPLKQSVQSYLKSDGPASVVVFLVALPLCLGVAVASDAPPISGIIAGAIGGIVVGLISKSNLSVSGPAAGLTAIVATSISELESFNLFLSATIIAGVIQIILGLLRAGLLGDYIPNAVIKGMLAAIGIMLILNQIPHLIGYQGEAHISNSIIQDNLASTFKQLVQARNYTTPLCVFIGLISLLILFIGDIKHIKSLSFFKLIHPALLVVLAGIVINAYPSESMKLGSDQLITLPVFQSITGLYFETPKPDFTTVFYNQTIWITAFTIAVVATLESLLSIEAVDKLDPNKNVTPAGRELVAQGSGNIVSGLLGGLPIASVIVRSSANVMSGAKTKMSTIFHGILLLLFVLYLPEVLNKIPKASLAGILIFTGYKLAKIELFREYFRKGWNQFLPFMITILAIVFTDLLVGILIGFAAGMFFVIRSNFSAAATLSINGNQYLICFHKDATFINKGHIKQLLRKIPAQATVHIDTSRTQFIDQDIIDLIQDFTVNADQKNIRVSIIHNDKKNT
jgi:carbonic anhydrase